MFDMFGRRPLQKRARQIAFRVNDEEYAAIEWMAQVLSQGDRDTYLCTDVLREAVAQLYEQLEADRGAQSESTRRTSGKRRTR